MVSYVDFTDRSGDPYKLAASLGVPGYAPKTLYNYIILAFW